DWPAQVAAGQKGAAIDAVRVRITHVPDEAVQPAGCRGAVAVAAGGAFHHRTFRVDDLHRHVLIAAEPIADDGAAGWILTGAARTKLRWGRPLAIACQLFP